MPDLQNNTEESAQEWSIRVSALPLALRLEEYKKLPTAYDLRERAIQAIATAPGGDKCQP